MDANIVYQDDNMIAFDDINPKAPIHILFVPKKHIHSVIHLGQEDKELMGEMILAIQKIAKEKELNGYRIIINVGREGGQIIDHLHFHLLSK